MNNGTNKFGLRLSCLALQSNSTTMANKKAPSGIARWPEDERPRERLLSRGPHALTDAELLAILLRVGLPGKSAVELGRDLIGRFGSIPGMMAAPLSAWDDIKGLKDAKKAQLLAALELGRRSALPAFREKLVGRLRFPLAWPGSGDFERWRFRGSHGKWLSHPRVPRRSAGGATECQGRCGFSPVT